MFNFNIHLDRRIKSPYPQIMNNYLHKTNKGDLYMYDLIAIIYRLTLIVFAVLFINFFINL